MRRADSCSVASGRGVAGLAPRLVTKIGVIFVPLVPLVLLVLLQAGCGAEAGAGSRGKGDSSAVSDGPVDLASDGGGGALDAVAVADMAMTSEGGADAPGDAETDRAADGPLDAPADASGQEASLDASPQDARIADAPADLAPDGKATACPASGIPCSGPTPACSSQCADSDGDGLNDAWESAQGIDMNCDGVIDAEHDALLPGADPTVADVYVQYDWMDYGPMETPCNVSSDCTIPAGLQKATCSGPPVAEGFTKSCVLSCAVDSDCATLGPTHAADRCQPIGEQIGVKQCVHTHDPAVLVPNGSGGSKAIDAVIEAYALHGIHLHVVRGAPLPHSHVLSLHTLGGAFPIANGCEGGSATSGTAGPGKYAESLYDLKSGSFDPKRALAYRYAVFAHYSSCDTAAHCLACAAAVNPDETEKSPGSPPFRTSGIAEITGNDLIISLANFNNEIGNPPDLFNVGGTFMHELGHTLGLTHGGGIGTDDGVEFKPNYLSVMNYNYQFSGIGVGAKAGDNVAKACTADVDCPSGTRCNPYTGCHRLDYSMKVLPTGTATPGLLDENGKLDEATGLGSGNSDIFFFTDAMCNFQTAATDGPVDWDGDGSAGDNPAVTADLNPAARTSSSCGAVTTLTFKGYADWGPGGGPSFTYAFQCAAKGAD